VQSTGTNSKITVLPGLAGPMGPVKVNTLVWNTCLCWNASSMGQDGWQSHNYGLLASEAGANMEACSSCCQASAFCNQSARCLLRPSRSIGSQQEWSCGSSCRCSGVWSVVLSVAWYTPCPSCWCHRLCLPAAPTFQLCAPNHRLIAIRSLPYKHRREVTKPPSSMYRTLRLP